MAQQYIFVMKELRKVVPPKRVLLDNIHLSFYPGAKIGVLGSNGSGKSTLMKIMAGVDKDFDGEAWAAEGTKIGYLAQEPDLDETLDVRGNVELAVKELRELLNRFDELNMKLGEEMSDAEMEKVMDEHGKVQDKIEAANAWEIDRTVEIAMAALRCPPAEAKVHTLSGGEKRRVALCKVLLSKPDLLLLDEPTNHLDAESVAWLEHHLESFPGTIVAVTHDRYFLDNVAQWILELDRGSGHPFEGNYTSWLEQKQKRLDQEDKKQDARQKHIAKELEWVRSSQKAKQTKSKARLARYEEMVAEAEKAKVDPAVDIVIPPGPRLGDNVVIAKNINKGFGDRLLIKDLSFKLPRGGIVGIIGANGVGKSTLFRMIVGTEKPDSGSMIVGDSVKIAYVDQSRATLDPKHNVWEAISEGIEVLDMGGRDVNSRAYVSSFNFKGQDQQKKVGTLSGGERNRVHLARTIKTGGNLLLLDEPTNDLDMKTLQALEAGVVNYPGCAVIISHDRWFLDRVATHIMAFEGDSHVEWFAGSYSDYEADRRRRFGDDAMVPKRVKYQTLTR